MMTSTHKNSTVRHCGLTALAAALLLLSGVAALPPALPLSSGPWVAFTNTSTTLTLSTPSFVLALDASAGSLLSLSDAPTASLFLQGSGALWVLQGPGCALSNDELPFSWVWSPESTTPSAHGSTATPARLRLEWGGLVRVDVTAPAGARWCDMTLTLLAAPPLARGAGFDSLWFPSQARFDAPRVANVFYPLLPGVLLNSSFFAPGAPTPGVIPYPGSGSFAELLHFNFSLATFSLFAVSGPDYAIPTFKGLRPVPNSTDWLLDRSINPVNVTPGCDPTNGGWTGGNGRPAAGSPPPCALGRSGVVVTRFAFGGSPLDDTLLYGVSNGLVAPPSSAPPGLVPYAGAGLLPRISEKMPMQTLVALARAPLYKLDAREYGGLFSSYAADVYPLLPVPGLVHSMAFEPFAFDHYYPDLLPPDPKFGSGCDLSSAFAAAGAAGHLTMPYANPTWWDLAAPTLARLSPAELLDVLAHNASGLPIRETYPDTPPATGVVTELIHPYVVARWRALMCQFSAVGGFCNSGAPSCTDGSLDCSVSHTSSARPSGATPCNETAVRLNSTFVFEDQLGARNARADFSPRQGGLGALGYMDAIVQHARNFSSVALATEQGFDKQARNVWGFFGNALETFDGPGYPWGGNHNWAVYPTAPAIFGESVLYHVHNLATTAFASGVPTLCWALSSGARLSIDAAQITRWSVADAAWYRFVGLVQRVAVSQYTGYALTAYDDVFGAGEPLAVGRGASRSRFANATGSLLFPTASAAYSVTTNWRNADTLAATPPLAWPAAPPGTPPPPSLLPPRGCAIWGEGGGSAAEAGSADVVAGVFAAYNGVALAAAPLHGIVEDRRCAWGGGGHVCVWHPLGADTPLSVAARGACAGGAAAVKAVARSGAATALSGVKYDNASGLVTFFAPASVAGMVVDFFAVACE